MGYSVMICNYLQYFLLLATLLRAMHMLSAKWFIQSYIFDDGYRPSTFSVGHIVHILYVIFRNHAYT